MPMRGNDDDDDEFEEALDDLRGRARLALDEADRALDAILADVGVELSAREDDEDEDDRGDPFGWRRSGGADGSAGGRFRLDPGDRAASGFGAGTGVDACLPRPIGGAELTRWARGAGLDEDTVLLVQTLHSPTGRPSRKPSSPRVRPRAATTVTGETAATVASGRCPPTTSSGCGSCAWRPSRR